jgi:hypothetical protein
MCFQREFRHSERLVELREEVQQSAAQAQQAILSQMEKFRDECLVAFAQCQAVSLKQVRQTIWLEKTLSELKREVQELREQLTKDRLF